MTSAWSVLIDKNLDTEVHKYKRPPSKDSTPLRVANTLPEACFHAELGKSSINFGDITSHKQTTDWYSPSVEASAGRYGDVAAFLFCKKRRNYAMLKDIWLSCLCDAQHCLLLREVLTGDNRGQVVFASLCVHGCVGIGWLCCWYCSSWRRQHVPAGGM